MDWKKIESAPRDKWILVYCGEKDSGEGEFYVGRFERLSQSQAVYGWLICYTDRRIGKVMMAREPTYWAELSAPAAVAPMKKVGRGRKN